MDPFKQALAILTAMITPAVLISACGALILSTSTRLSRVTDRVRALATQLEELALGEKEIAFRHERRSSIFEQLNFLTSRARLLQRAMTAIYSALGVFLATSISLGVVAVSGASYAWLPVVCGLFGAALLFYAGLLLIFESRLALNTINKEMDFIWKLGLHYRPQPEDGHHRHNSGCCFTFYLI